MQSLDAVGDSVDGYTDKQGQVESASESMAGDLDKVSESADGTSDSIKDLNGNPVNVQTNKDEAVSQLDSITNSVNKIPVYKAITVAVSAVGAAVSSIFGQHYNGLDYVPFDGYTATLHKGERVLTAEENKKLYHKWWQCEY